MKIKSVLCGILFSVFSFQIFSQVSESKIQVTENVSFQMVQIPGKNFFIGKTQVTQELYEAVTGDNPSHNAGPNFPVDSVSWFDAVIFCNKLSITTGRKPYYSLDGSVNPDDWDLNSNTVEKLKEDISSDGFRLPSKEEWEFAAKGGENFIYPGSNNLDEVAWNKKNSGYLSHEAALKKPNGYGIYDMAGNVWEWCSSWYPAKRKYKILKGGSATSDSRLCQISFSGHHYPSRSQPCYSYYNFGFRLACTKSY